jgi:hypothetical protein
MVRCNGGKGDPTTLYSCVLFCNDEDNVEDMVAKRIFLDIRSLDLLEERIVSPSTTNRTFTDGVRQKTTIARNQVIWNQIMIQ